MTWFWIVSGLLLLLDYVYFKLRYTTKNGPPTWYLPPLIGLIPLLFFLLPERDFGWPYRVFLRVTPKVFLLRLFGPWVLVKEDAVQEIQMSDHCLSRPSVPFFDLVGYLLAGKKHWAYFDGGHRESTSDHREQRKLTLSALYASPRRDIEAKLIDIIDLFLRNVETQKGRVWDISDELALSKVQEVTYMTVGETLDKSELQLISVLLDDFKKYISPVLLLVEIIPLKLLLRIMNILPKKWSFAFHSQVYHAVVKRLQQERSVPISRVDTNDFVEAVLHIKSDQEANMFLREAAPLVLIGMYHTSFRTLTVFLQLLAAYPNHQQRIIDEIDAVIGTNVPSMDHSDKMHFTKAFMAECWRIHPPLPFLFRKSTGPVTLGGYEIPVGSNLLGFLHSENCDPMIFNEPRAFRPERHFDDLGKFVKDPRIDIFSRGRRSCPGKQYAVISNFLYLARFLQHFEIRPAKSRAVNSMCEPDGSLSPKVFTQKLRPVRRRNAPLIREVSLRTGVFRLVMDCAEGEANKP